MTLRNLIASLRMALRGTTPEAERAAELPPITGPGAVTKVERPSSTPCTPQMRCETCRRLNRAEEGA